MSDSPDVRSGRIPRRPLLMGGVLAVAAVVVAVVIISDGSDGTGDVAAGPQVPSIELEWFDGSTGSLGDYEGAPLVVNFWASWCPSCVAEMASAFRPAQQAVGDRVAFLGVNLQDERDEAVRLVDETGVLFDLAEDTNGDLYSALNGIGMPFTVFVDENGAIVHRHNGPLTERQLLDIIEERLLA